MTNSKPFSLDIKDFGKGLFVTVLAAVLATLAQAFNVPGFDFATFNWGSLISVAMTAGIAYLGKNFVSDKEGVPFGSAK